MGGDFNDFAQGRSDEDLRAHVDELTSKPNGSGGGDSRNPPSRGVLLDLPSWQDRPVPKREWLIPNWIPLRHVTALYGDGGIGKSLLAQQLLTATATERAWLGLGTMRCRALGAFCEDGEEDLLLRQQEINAAFGIDFADLGDMHLWSLVGDDALLMTFDDRNNGVGKLTEFFAELRSRALDFHARLLVIDTAADTFGGNENTRAQVRQSCGPALRAWPST